LDDKAHGKSYALFIGSLKSGFKNVMNSDMLFSSRFLKYRLMAVMSAIIMTMSVTVPAAPMTKDQGDAILKELREIKQLLARPQQQQAQAAPQTPQNLTVKGDAIYVLGKSDAPLTLVEFTDYQCPFCGRFETTTFPAIKKNYIDTGKLRLIVRDLPLDGLHPFALKAAQSVHCAGDQGKFWEMKELVFKNQNKLDVDSLAGYAKDLALNGVTFKSCMADGKHLQEIGNQVRYAQSLGITGTPTFILGKTAGDSVEGRVIVGAQPFEAFEAAIDEMLGKL
jgi:protein-disulfide isomerase